MFENYIDWAISSQALNRGRFNDYLVREYTTSDWLWKWYIRVILHEKI